MRPGEQQHDLGVVLDGVTYLIHELLGQLARSNRCLEALELVQAQQQIALFAQPLFDLREPSGEGAERA